MHHLTHYRLCPRSRAIRLALAERHLSFETAEVQPWSLADEFLQLNPAGELPVLQIDNGAQLTGVYAIVEYLTEAPSQQTELTGTEIVPDTNLIPGDSAMRAEVRRLTDWFLYKLEREVSRELLYEKVYARQTAETSHSPDSDILRAIRSNLRYHLSYISYLAHRRHWLAGGDLSFADLMAAAQLSSIDYLGEVPWDDYPVAKNWYVRLKSRPSFRAILKDRLPGVPPPLAYTDLDF